MALEPSNPAAFTNPPGANQLLEAPKHDGVVPFVGGIVTGTELIRHADTPLGKPNQRKPLGEDRI
ncbi:MAG: hypothetical protein JO243_18820 [Solirubrobacterales bacterium]|nr:hypothetical protein [Solirubrobacterales bacterium]